MPKNIPERFRREFKRIQALKNDGKYEEALEESNRLVNSYPKSGLAYLQNGGLFWDLGKLDEAIISFRKAVDIFPNTEKASLCLFHVLWNKGLRFDALEEMKRFLSNNRSDEYTKLLESITVNLNDGQIDTNVEIENA